MVARQPQLELRHAIQSASVAAGAASDRRPRSPAPPTSRVIQYRFVDARAGTRRFVDVTWGLVVSGRVDAVAPFLQDSLNCYAFGSAKIKNKTKRSCRRKGGRRGAAGRRGGRERAQRRASARLIGSVKETIS
ncbi:hypothetical protein EVAR_46311_1 [Eumeta japonica]|uniref:Uncharacterized protein n=1 Tax=Eumeta variegata TaxID=151549 RepID=A0A4C1XX46_EUMVA|nr:hypothetical protein EVAR_46311_1 [Eumeta japonica]